MRTWVKCCLASALRPFNGLFSTIRMCRATKRGITALHEAAATGQLQHAKASIEKRESFSSVQQIFTVYVTPYCMQELVAAGASLHLEDSNGNTALHWAVLRQQLHMIAFLLDMGSSMKNKNR